MLLLTACAQRIPFEREMSSLPLPASDYINAAAAGAAVYEILPKESLLLIRVGRAGTMAHLGHDHAIASKDLQGYVEIAADRAKSRADIAMPLKSLIVDQADYRERLKLESSPSPDDIAGTYSNMRRVLEAEEFPWVTVKVRFATDNSMPADTRASITLHGVSLDFTVPVEINFDEKRMSVSGRLAVTQSDFGLMPFSAVGGLLRVADELQVEFELVAVRLLDAGETGAVLK
jgi:polyisoprenoid-binding protein YceI